MHLTQNFKIANFGEMDQGVLSYTQGVITGRPFWATTNTKSRGPIQQTSKREET